MAELKAIKGDITNIAAHAIVNAANSSLMSGSGVDGAIHRAGGTQILEECKAIVARQGKCKTGEVVITSAGKLPSEYVIHTVGPVWQGGKKGEAEKLVNCYLNSLKLADNKGCRSIAFPNISTGIYNYPKREAAKIAVDTVKKFVTQTKIEEVIFVCFDEENYRVINELLK
ncbi:MAG: O-acetyl-ADP-ribose deacetylase [Bacteroidota bacterium]|nr:O-acetyl-ADP-ribose deacetylase [Bacteroidota bacterium]